DVAREDSPQVVGGGAAARHDNATFSPTHKGYVRSTTPHHAPVPRPWTPPPLDTTPSSARTHRSRLRPPPQENSPFSTETKPSPHVPGSFPDPPPPREAAPETRPAGHALKSKGKSTFPARRKTATNGTRTGSEDQGARRGGPRSEERTRERPTDHRKTGRRTTDLPPPERVPSGGAEERTNGDPRGYGSTAPGIEVPGLRSQKPHHRRTGHRARWPIHDGGQGFVPTGGRYPFRNRTASDHGRGQPHGRTPKIRARLCAWAPHGRA